MKEYIKNEKTNCISKFTTTSDMIPTILDIFGIKGYKNLYYGNSMFIKNVESINMYSIQWDVDSCDWMEGHTAERIKNDVLKKVKAGSIILFHNAAVNTPAALPGIIESLIADGYSFSKISDLIYKENYTIDHTGKQCKIKDGN